MGYEGLVGIAQESTFGTFVTSTAWLEFNSESLKHNIEQIKLESINGLRDYKKILQGNTTIEGSVEAPFCPAETGCILFLKQAMGGTCTVAAASGTSYAHTFNLGNMESNKSSAGAAADYKGLSIAARPGASAVKTFNFYGCRVNNWTIKGEANSPIIFTADLIGKGCSTSSTLPAASYSDINPVTFVGASFKSGTTTTFAAEYVRSFELSLNNNINTDHRVLGSREVAQLPPAKRNIGFKVTQVFDTSTAYDRFTQQTQTAWEITLDTLIARGSSAGTYKAVITLYDCRLGPNTPVVSGPGPIVQELNYTCLYASTPAKAMDVVITNKTANYD